MNKKIFYIGYLCAVTVSSVYVKTSEASHDILPTAAALDGLLIKENDIGHMYQLGTKVEHLLKGPHTPDAFSMQDLISLEQKGIMLPEKRNALLKDLKASFLEVSSQCLAAAHGSKTQFIPLIREWARVHIKPLSPLLRWAEVEEQQEHEHFNKTITTFEKFNEFCLDLLTFLSDIINSCPKAHALFKQRMEKLHVIHDILPKIATISPQEEKRFITYIVKHHLTEKLTSITIETVKELWNEFRKSH